MFAEVEGPERDSLSQFGTPGFPGPTVQVTGYLSCYWGSFGSMYMAAPWSVWGIFLSDVMSPGMFADQISIKY